MRAMMFVLAATAMLAAGCADGQGPGGDAAAMRTSVSYDKSGFWTKEQDGRLWVFAANSKELAEFQKHGEPARQVTRIGAGPNGMTIKSSDSTVIDAYLVAK